VRYYYDGDGKRTMKVVCQPGASSCDASTSGATITSYVYDASGSLAAEYGGASPDTGRNFVFADALGSTRLYAPASGSPAKCYDYLPFGEEIGQTYGGRSTSCYGSVSYPQTEDVVREKFTSKERDAETGLDYFGARYFSSDQGRFTSPDRPQVDRKRTRKPC
jgi:RHS repeat-associated protein